MGRADAVILEKSIVSLMGLEQILKGCYITVKEVVRFVECGISDFISVLCSQLGSHTGGDVDLLERSLVRNKSSIYKPLLKARCNGSSARCWSDF